MLWAGLPRETHFDPVRSGGGWWAAARDHLRNRRLLATYAVGFCVLFSLLGTFTYITFKLAAEPFHMRPAALGSLFFVYLIGALITPASGKWIDRYGPRVALAIAIGCGVCGVLLTLSLQLWAVLAGLAVCCTGVFIAQSAASSYIGIAACHNRALAVGLYVTFYYLGGGAGSAVPGLLWPLGGWPACVALIASMQILTVAIALRFWPDPESRQPPAREALARV